MKRALILQNVPRDRHHELDLFLYSAEGINRTDKHGQTVLIKYMFLAQPISVQALVHLALFPGFAINHKTKQGANALIVAASLNCPYPVFHVLVKAGCDTAVKTCLNHTVFDVLVKH